MSIKRFCSELTDLGPPVDKVAITDFEREFFIVLPEDYRQFLLTCNGGYPGNLVFDLPTLNDATVLHGLNGLRDDGYSLRKANEPYMVEMVGPGYLMVGFDVYNSQICLSMSPEDHGRVYFADWLLRNDDDTLKLHPLHGTFEEFLASLRREDPE